MKAQPNSHSDSVVSIFEISAEADKALSPLKSYQSDVGTLMAQSLLIKKKRCYHCGQSPTHT